MATQEFVNKGISVIWLSWQQLLNFSNKVSLDLLLGIALNALKTA